MLLLHIFSSLHGVAIQPFTSYMTQSHLTITDPVKASLRAMFQSRSPATTDGVGFAYELMSFRPGLGL